MTYTAFFTDPDYDVIKQHKEASTLQRYGFDISSIEISEDYFSTDAQINKSEKSYVDRTDAKLVANSERVSGLFSNSSPIKKSGIVSAERTNVGPDFGYQWSTNKQILPNVYTENTQNKTDKFRQGVDIRQPGQYVVGLAKITSGTPGHVIKPSCFGINELNIGGNKSYSEIDLFDPVRFINLQEGDKPINRLVTFPIVTSDVNQLENYLFNGIIEPFPIRSVISLFSINTPFEPRSVKGQFGNGNLNTRFATGQVVSVDYFNQEKINESWFLDAVDIVGMKNEEGDVAVNLGPSIGYYSIDENHLDPFEDAEPARDTISEAAYGNDMIEALKMLKPGGTSYISRKEKSYSTGFMYDNLGPAGVDSIAFGGLTY